MGGHFTQMGKIGWQGNAINKLEIYRLHLMVTLSITEGIPSVIDKGARLEKISGIKCSTSHFSKEDEKILNECSRREGYWIHDTHYGYLIVLSGYKHPCLKLKELGVSKSVRKLVHVLMKEQGIEILMFDRDADTLEDFAIYEW